MKNTLFLIDAYNLIYRMFYAIPEMLDRSGKNVNVIFGVAKFLRSLASENPHAYIAVATDVGQSFRSNIAPDYKGTRERMPDNLRSQIEDVFSLFSAAGITVLSQEGYEADDIIGSIAYQHKNDDYQIVIISSDKDLCQFVRDGHVHIYDAMKKKFMKEADVVDKFGVPPAQVMDYLAIVGDASDNIPGITGFGPKKAVDLLSKYTTLEGIYRELGVDLVHQSQSTEAIGEYHISYERDLERFEISDMSLKLKQGLLDNIQNAFLSQKLARIITHLPLIEIPRLAVSKAIERIEYIDILKKYEFRSLLPAGESLPNKETQEIQVSEIIHPEDLLSLQKTLELASGYLVISTIGFPKIVFSYEGTVYSIHTKRIDCSDFFTVLLSNPHLDIVGYNLKEDIKHIYGLNNPTDVMSVGNEEQGRLF